MGARGRELIGLLPVTLLLLGLVIAAESVRRLVSPPDVRGGLVFATAAVGAAVNVAALWQVAKANRSSLNAAMLSFRVTPFSAPATSAMYTDLGSLRLALLRASSTVSNHSRVLAIDRSPSRAD